MIIIKSHKNARDILANNIVYFRLKKGWTQEELAEHLGSKPNYISYLENGKLNSRIDFIGRLANTLGVSLEQLFIEREKQYNHHVNRQ